MEKQLDQYQVDYLTDPFMEEDEEFLDDRCKEIFRRKSLNYLNS